jgi:trans-aconitate methyltransferase
MTSEHTRSEKQWDARRYDGGQSFVWKYGASLIELLDPREGERVLDIGCGTGHLAAKIASRGAEVIGIDKSQDMVEQARRLYPDLRFEVVDATGFHFDEPFDAVFSNATIHWIKDQDALTSRIFGALRSGGRLVAEFGGKGNLRAVKAALARALDQSGYPIAEEVSFRFFATIGEYATLLERHGFTVTEAFYFERPTPLEGDEAGLRNWLAVFADNALAAAPETERAAIVRDIEEQLRPELYKGGTWFADYRRLRVAAVRDEAR